MDRDSSLGMALPLEIHAFPLIFPSFLCSLCGISGISARFIRAEMLFANLETEKFKSRLIFSIQQRINYIFLLERSFQNLEKVIKYFSLKLTYSSFLPFSIAFPLSVSALLITQVPHIFMNNSFVVKIFGVNTESQKD